MAGACVERHRGWLCDVYCIVVMKWVLLMSNTESPEKGGRTVKQEEDVTLGGSSLKEDEETTWGYMIK